MLQEHLRTNIDIEILLQLILKGIHVQEPLI